MQQIRYLNPYILLNKIISETYMNDEIKDFNIAVTLSP